MRDIAYLRERLGPERCAWAGQNPLRAWRMSKDVTIGDMSELSGWGESTVAGYETGDNYPSMKRLIHIGQTIGATDIAAQWLAWVKDGMAILPQSKRLLAEAWVKHNETTIEKMTGGRA